MWEYRWVEVAVGEAQGLEAVGREGWEAVGVTSTGDHFGKPYVGILMKRAKTHDLDLTAMDVTAVDRDTAAYATAVADRIESHWSDDDIRSLVPDARPGGARSFVR